MRDRYFVGQADDEGVMVIDRYETYQKSKIIADGYNRGTFVFEGQEEPGEYPYDVFYVEQEDDLSED